MSTDAVDAFLAAEHEQQTQMYTCFMLGVGMPDLMRYRSVVEQLASRYPWENRTVQRIGWELMRGRIGSKVWVIPTTAEQCDLWSAALFGGVYQSMNDYALFFNWQADARVLWGFYASPAE